MAFIVLKEGFEEAVRAKLGVGAIELPNEVINQRLIANLAEQQVLKSVPEYTQITDIGELMLLEGSVIARICSLLAPSMPRRLNLEVSTLDVKWKKEKIDWVALAESFSIESESALAQIESIEVDFGGDSSLVDYSRADRTPIG